MDYRPPSVDIIKVQETTSIAAGVSDLLSGIVGPAYNVVELGDYKYDAVTIPAAGLTFSVDAKGVDSNQEIDGKSIYAEFVSAVGETVIFTGTTSFANGKFVFTVASGKISDLFPRAADASNNQYTPRIAYRALYKNRNKEVSIQSSDDITYSAGKVSSLNPLGFAAGLMLQNTGNAFNAYAIPASGTGTTDWQGALDALESSDIYALAPLTDDKDSFFTAFQTWANTRSLPKNSRPTKIYFSPFIKWSDDKGDIAEKQLSAIPKDANGVSLADTTFDFAIYRISKVGKKKTAESIAAQSTNIGNSRITFVHPDMAWITENRHVLQCKPTYVADTCGVSGGKAVLAVRTKLVDGTVYESGTIITDAVWATLTGKTLKDSQSVYNLQNFMIDVLIPSPGYYLAVQQASLVSALVPSDPKTQRPVGGIAKVDLSENFFGTDYTNIIAGGGTTVIVQPTLSVLPVSRHHLTTDMTTIESREDNIIHQLDAVTLNFRRVLSELVGKYKQDAKYYKLLRATLMAYAEEFKKKEFAKDVQVIEVAQSPDQKDKVLVTLRVLPYYAANYIDVTIYY